MNICIGCEQEITDLSRLVLRHRAHEISIDSLHPECFEKSKEYAYHQRADLVDEINRTKRTRTLQLFLALALVIPTFISHRWSGILILLPALIATISYLSTISFLKAELSKNLLKSQAEREQSWQR